MTGADAPRARITGYTLALHYLPLAQLVAGAAFVYWQATSVTAAIAWALAWLYLVPPLVCRLTIALFGRPQGRGLTQQSRAYKVWWFTYQWQVVFNRVPWLDEILRPAPRPFAFLDFFAGRPVSPLGYFTPGSLAVPPAL